MSVPTTLLRRRLVLLAVAAVAVVATACEPISGPSTMVAGDTLPSGAGLVSPDGNGTVTMEADGNLVHRLYGTVVWTSKTSGHPGARLVMRTQGNLAVISTGGSILWSTPVAIAGSFVELGGDGNLVQRGSDRQPFWANGVSADVGWRIPASLRTVSPQQVTLTKMYEGYTSGVPYNDVYQNCTVGYGHLIHLGACTAADRAKTWDADALFAADVTEHERRLKSTLGAVLMSQREFDALWDYVFNRGSLTAKTAPGTYAAMTAQPPRYADVPAILRSAGNASIKGLCNRRYDEAQTFAGGDYARNYVC